jgi:hypothetical protein
MKQRIDRLSNRRWAAISPLLAHRTFTSIAATHLERCWPTQAIHIRKLFDQRNEAFAPYDLEPDKRESFCNTEFVTGSVGKIKTIEVYFESKIGRARGHQVAP